jgi:hypothetical protein
MAEDIAIADAKVAINFFIYLSNFRLVVKMPLSVNVNHVAANIVSNVIGIFSPNNVLIDNNDNHEPINTIDITSNAINKTSIPPLVVSFMINHAPYIL